MTEQTANTETGQLTKEQYEQYIAEARAMLDSPYTDEATRTQIQQRITEMETAVASGNYAGGVPKSAAAAPAGQMGGATDVLAISGQSLGNPDLRLTVEQYIMIQNFADRTPDSADKKGYKIRVVDANGNLSSRYYGSKDGVIYRKGDKDRKPVHFSDLHLQLNEFDYERYLVALKKYQRENGRKINALSDDEIAEQEKKKPWLVRSADWLDKNLFGTIAGYFGDSGLLSLLGKAVKIVGGVLTGLMRTIGYAFNGEWSKAGESAIGWVKDAAITAVVAWGASKAVSYVKDWMSSNDDTTTDKTTTTTTTTTKTTNVSTVVGGGLSSEAGKKLTGRLNTSAVANAEAAQLLSKVINQNSK